MIIVFTTWRDFDFHVFYSNHIPPDDETVMENLARCIICPGGHTM
jgi:hypothetical protein